ncbi:acetolactate synthase small subunit, partial [Phascolarctobacterium succinatutens]
MKQILSIVAHNRPGVLMRVTGLISRRGYNIDSLTSGSTQDPEYARMTIVLDADELTIEQVCKQLAKLSEVERIK